MRPHLVPVLALFVAACAATIEPSPSLPASQPASQPATSAEQAVLVFIKLSDGAFGTADETEAIADLGDRLGETVALSQVGEYDGYDFGDGWGTLFFYGSDADRLAQIVRPPVMEFEPPPGSYLIRRYGPPDAPEQREELAAPTSS